MQVLRKMRPAAGLDLVDVPEPAATSPDEVLVRVIAAGICGSDLHVDDWTPSYAFITPAIPVTIGHEFVGVAEGGPLAGRRVVVRPSVTCGVCPACAAGASLAEATAPYTEGRPFDRVFEATGVPETINDALALLRRNGVVVTGIHTRPLALDLTALVRRQQQLRGSFRPPESDWPAALDLMLRVGASMRPMVSHVLPLCEAHAGFALAHGKQASKVLLRPEAVDEH